MIYPCLSIAGFDGSGGAGIQADLKTFAALGCYGLSVLTALPVQNTCGVRNCYNISLSCIEEQLESIFDDITPKAIKIGMLFSQEIIECVANFLRDKVKNIPIVLDPVMVAKSGDLLLQKNAIETLKSLLIPLATIITPNLPEAYALIGKEYEKNFLIHHLLNLGCKAVLLKGGHEKNPESSDMFLDHEGKFEILSTKRITSKNTHGTGCTLSAAIASFLTQGLCTLEACKYGKNYLFNALYAAKDHKIGKGHGPVHHFYPYYSL